MYVSTVFIDETNKRNWHSDGCNCQIKLIVDSRYAKPTWTIEMDSLLREEIVMNWL